MTTTLAFSYSGADTRFICEICGGTPAVWRIRYRDGKAPKRVCYPCAFVALKDGDFIEQLLSDRVLEPYDKQK
jgi:hypothetical protein